MSRISFRVNGLWKRHHIDTNNIYHPPTKIRECNVFTGVCLSFWSGDPHLTISDDTFDLTKQGYPYQPCSDQTRAVGTPWPLPLSRHGSWQAPSPCSPANDIWWTSLETCSNLFIWPHWIASSHTHCCSTEIWWPPKHVQLASGWYTPYLNAYLFNDIQKELYW